MIESDSDEVDEMICKTCHGLGRSIDGYKVSELVKYLVSEKGYRCVQVGVC